MKNQLTILCLLFSLSIFGQTELNLDWERVTDIPGLPRAIIQSNDTLFAFTGTSIFYSIDEGDNWIWSSSENDLVGESTFDINESQLIMSKTIHSSTFGNKFTGNSFLDHVLFYKGNTVQYQDRSKYHTGNSWGGGSKQFAFIESAHVFDENSFYYTTIGRNEVLGRWAYVSSIDTTFHWKINSDTIQHKILYSFGTNDFVEDIHRSKIHNIFGHIGNQFISIENDSIFLFNDTSIVISKSAILPIDEKDILNKNVLGDKIFICTKDKKIYSNSLGLNEEWTFTKTNFEGELLVYEIKNGLHIFKTKNIDYLSTDLQEYYTFPNEQFSKPTNYWVFSNLILAKNNSQLVRSKDNGKTWQEVYVSGIFADYIPNAYHIDGEIIQETPKYENIYEVPGEKLIKHEIVIAGDTLLASFIKDNGGGGPDELKIYYSLDKGISWTEIVGFTDVYNNPMHTIVYYENNNFYIINNKVRKYADLTKSPKVLFDTEVNAKPIVYNNTQYDFIFQYEDWKSSLYIVDDNTILISPIVPTINKVKKYSNYRPSGGFQPQHTIDYAFHFSEIKEANDYLYAFSSYNGLWRLPIKKCDTQYIIGQSCDDGNPETYSETIQEDCTCQGIGIKEYCKTNDFEALSKIYKVTKGRFWTHNDNWLSEKPLNEWYGVRTNPDGCVTGLDLDGIDDFGLQRDSLGNNLIGNFPREIANLDHLQSIFLSNNEKLKWHWSKDFFNLNIKEISIANVRNSGIRTNKIEDFQKFDSLKIIDIQSVLNSGQKIPNSFFDNQQLEYVDLSYNYLHTKFSKIDMPNLKHLDLSYNSIYNTLPEIINGKNIEYLNFAHNDFRGCFPNGYTFLCDKETNFSKNNLLPWSGDFSEFCSGHEQIGAPCKVDYGHKPAVITDDCECVELVEEKCRVKDSTLLTLLYNKLNGQNWTYSSNWLSNAPLSTWYGITTNDDGCVTKVELPNNNLKGELFFDIVTLEFLETLDLSQNDIHGCFDERLLMFCNQIEMDYSDNPKLPYFGNYTQYCAAQGQIGAPCDDGNPDSHFDKIKDNCECKGEEELCREREFAVLKSLYEKLDGDNWLYNTNWLTNKPFKNWKGIRTNSEGCITSINLSYNKLNGILPENIGELQHLEYINLSVNKNLFGFLPNSFYTLKKLKYLNLSHSNITGKIKKDIEDLTELRYLNLNSSGFNGYFSSKIGSLDKLKYLNLSSTQLTGNIPKEIGNLINLDTLKLYGGNFSGKLPMEIGNLLNLDYLDLSRNEFSGRIPSNFDNLTNIAHIDLSVNKFTGQIPESFGNFKKIKYLNLYHNDFRKCIPESLKNHCYIISSSSREVFRFDGNPKLPWMGNKEKFCKDYDQIGAPCDDRNDETINDFIDENCNCRGNLITETCRTRDSTILAEIFLKCDGQNWKWNNNWMSKAPLNEWSGIQATEEGCVTKFYGKELGMKGELPNSISNLKYLEYLDLSDNELTGPIPENIGNLQNLNSLTLNSNNFSGNIPSSIGKMKYLKKLFFPGNKLEGEIPVTIGNLTQLQLLSLRDNKLTGSIPESFSNLTKLTGFSVRINKLSGEMPEWLDQLKDVDWIYLSDNNFEGCFPTSYKKFCSIREKEFKNNPKMPWKGDFEKFCTNSPQIGAPCENEKTINETCGCGDIKLADQTASNITKFNIIPNPNNGVFTLDIAFLQRENINIKIYSPLGKIIFTEKLNIQSIRESIEISDFSSGLYFIEITTEEGSLVKKMIIE